MSRQNFRCIADVYTRVSITVHWENLEESCSSNLVYALNHGLSTQDVMELRSQIAKSGVHVDVDAPKGQDLSQIMAEIRAKYEKMALKNQEELKAWHESQVRHQFVIGEHLKCRKLRKILATC